jgi:ABC-type branched-subunit amino acid transport system substrate-binding protein
LRGVKKPVFVDSFFRQSKTPAMQQLLRLHERILYRHQNYIGPTSYTAYAYDTLMILMQLLKKESNQSHSELRNALANMQIYPGVTGDLSFDEKGEVLREMQLLTLRRGKIQLLKH